MMEEKHQVRFVDGPLSGKFETRRVFNDKIKVTVDSSIFQQWPLIGRTGTYQYSATKDFHGRYIYIWRGYDDEKEEDRP